MASLADTAIACPAVVYCHNSACMLAGRLVGLLALLVGLLACNSLLFLSASPTSTLANPLGEQQGHIQ